MVRNYSIVQNVTKMCVHTEVEVPEMNFQWWETIQLFQMRQEFAFITKFVKLRQTVLQPRFARVNLDWPTAVAGEVDSVSSMSASVCHTGKSRLEYSIYLWTPNGTFPLASIAPDLCGGKEIHCSISKSPP